MGAGAADKVYLLELRAKLMASKSTVEGFLAHRRIAVVGVSRNGRGFGHLAWKALRTKGWDAVPINPNAAEVDGVRCYPTLGDLPAGSVQAALVVTPPGVTEQVVEEAAAAGIRSLWLQPGAQSDRALDLCREHRIEAISGECIMMHAKPEGFHGFHRWLWNVMGKLPK